MPIYYSRQRVFPRALQSGYGRKPSAQDVVDPANPTPGPVQEPGSHDQAPEYAPLPDEDADHSQPLEPVQAPAQEAPSIPPGHMLITPEQVDIHKKSEALAVFLGIPFMLWLAMNKDLPSWARWGAGIFAAGTLYVDGGLLHSWEKKERGEPGMWGQR